MTGTITLDDGTQLYGSNMGLGGTFEEIAEAIYDSNPLLARWLSDVAQRPGGFMDFDLRGLEPGSRASFWAGVDRAYEKYADWDQEALFSATVGVTRLFYERRDAHLHAAEDGTIPPIDLNDLWYPANPRTPNVR